MTSLFVLPMCCVAIYLHTKPDGLGRVISVGVSSCLYSCYNLVGLSSFACILWVIDNGKIGLSLSAMCEVEVKEPERE